MGRLIDSVAAALGLKPSDRVDLSIAVDDVTSNEARPPVDCETCRITGATALGGCGVYAIITVWRNPRNLEGKQLRNLRVAGVLLATGQHNR
jgi:hypothetical protein